jgi:hypothetical protein
MPNPGRDKDQRQTFAERLGAIFEHRWFVPAVACIGLLFRLALLFYTSRHKFVFLDELDYDTIAVSLWKTHKYSMYFGPTAFRPPAEPLFIAAVYATLGQKTYIVELFQAVLLTALPFLCAALGRRLGLSVRAANAGALLASLHPGLAYAATTLYPTALTAVALTAGLLSSSIAAGNDSKADSVKGGLALGLAGSFTTTFVPLPLLVAFYCLWKRKMRAALIIGIVGMAPAILWLVRNHHVFGEYTLATNGGLNLLIGANDDATPRSGNWVSLPPYDAPIILGDETGQDHVYRRQAGVWIKAHPMRYAWLCIERGVIILDSVGKPKTKGIHSGLGEKLVGWGLFPITLLSLVGLIVQRRKPASFLTAAALLLIAASSAFTLVKPRFRFPLDPVLSVFAVAAIAGLLPSFFRLEAQPREVSGMVSGSGSVGEVAR